MRKRSRISWPIPLVFFLRREKDNIFLFHFKVKLTLSVCNCLDGVMLPQQKERKNDLTKQRRCYFWSLQLTWTDKEQRVRCCSCYCCSVYVALNSHFEKISPARRTRIIPLRDMRAYHYTTATAMLWPMEATVNFFSKKQKVDKLRTQKPVPPLFTSTLLHKPVTVWDFSRLPPVPVLVHKLTDRNSGLRRFPGMRQGE